MTQRRYGYTRDDSVKRKHSDEYLFCIDAAASEYENEFCPIILRARAAQGDELIASIWFKHKEDVVPEYIKQHPGQRPSLWWRYTWPQLHPEIEPPDELNAYSRARTPEQRQKQQSFLHRYNLLSASERKRVPKPKVGKPQLTVIKGNDRG